MVLGAKARQGLLRPRLVLLSAAGAGGRPAATSLCGLQLPLPPSTPLLPSVPPYSLRPLKVAGLSDAGVGQSPSQSKLGCLHVWMDVNALSLQHYGRTDLAHATFDGGSAKHEVVFLGIHVSGRRLDAAQVSVL